MVGRCREIWRHAFGGGPPATPGRGRHCGAALDTPALSGETFSRTTRCPRAASKDAGGPQDVGAGAESRETRGAATPYPALVSPFWCQPVWQDNLATRGL